MIIRQSGLWMAWISVKSSRGCFWDQRTEKVLMYYPPPWKKKKQQRQRQEE